mmetsp:Transcript_41318/g.104721  ORF Transcript_41318/g.104721 Transcript_41318/m.104721 type:complete len:223 (+) Transcript_41318:804-1472(+)
MLTAATASSHVAHGSASPVVVRQSVGSCTAASSHMMMRSMCTEMLPSLSTRLMLTSSRPYFIAGSADTPPIASGTSYPVRSVIHSSTLRSHSAPPTSMRLWFQKGSPRLGDTAVVRTPGNSPPPCCCASPSSLSVQNRRPPLPTAASSGRDPSCASTAARTATSNRADVKCVRDADGGEYPAIARPFAAGAVRWGPNAGLGGGVRWRTAPRRAALAACRDLC